MNRFFRSALFPLIVIVLLVYLASQTLMDGRKDATRVPYSQVVRTVQRNPGAIEKVVLQRNRGVVVERADGTTWKATNPSEPSQLALERLLIERGITYDWKNNADSVWWSFVVSLAPFVLLLVFWVVWTRQRDERIRLSAHGGDDTGREDR